MDAKGGCSPQNNLENCAASNRGWRRWQQQFTRKFTSPASTLQQIRVRIRDLRAFEAWLEGGGGRDCPSHGLTGPVRFDLGHRCGAGTRPILSFAPDVARTAAEEFSMFRFAVDQVESRIQFLCRA
jgi:hypothetical protein